jgi:hypothetical protein
MGNPLVIEAQKYLDKVDFIVDLYDNSFVWGSLEMLKDAGYTAEELTKIKTLDTLDSSVNQDAYRKELMEEVDKGHGTRAVMVHSKTGQKMRLTFEYYVFEFDGGHWMAGKGLKVEKLP